MMRIKLIIQDSGNSLDKHTKNLLALKMRPIEIAEVKMQNNFTIVKKSSVRILTLSLLI